MDLSEMIIELLSKKPGQTAKEMARRFGVSRKEVNQVLYCKLDERVWCNGEYRWHIKELQKTVMEEPLQHGGVRTEDKQGEKSEQVDLPEMLIEALSKKPRQTAKDLARRLGASRKEINKILYGNLSDCIRCDNEHRWCLIEPVENGRNQMPLIRIPVDSKTESSVPKKIEYNVVEKKEPSRNNFCDSKDELSFLKSLRLSIGNEQYSSDEYILLNSRLFLENMFQKESKGLLILHPTGFFLTAIAGVVFPLFLAKHDIIKASDNVSDYLGIGDMVHLDGCLGEVSGIEERNGVKSFIIKFTNMNLLIPFDRFWRLQKYEGKAGIQKYKHNPKEKTRKQKAALCQILGLNEEDVSPVLQSKTLFVSEKQLFVSNMEKTAIDNVLYTTVFPTGYFKDCTEPERIGSDPLQRRPLVCIVSSLEVACKMVETDPLIKAVVIHDLKQLQGNYTYLLKIKENVPNIIVLQYIQKFDEEDLDRLSKMGFSIFHWSPDNIKTLKLNCEAATGYSKDLNRIHRIIYRIKNPNRRLVLVENEVSEIMQQVKTELEKLRRYEFESDIKHRFIMQSFNVLLNLRAVPIPLQNPIIDNEYFIKAMQDLLEMKINFRLSTDDNILISVNCVVEKIKQLIDSHIRCHPKYREFTLVDSLGQNDCIVVPKKRQKDIMEKWLDYQRGKDHGISVNTLTEMGLNNRFYNQVVFTGWFGEKHAKLLLTPIADKETFLLFPFEQEWKEKNESWIRRLLDKYNLSNNKTEEISVEYDLERYINKMGENIQSYYQGIHTANPEDIGLTESCYFVEFEDDYYAFLTEGYNCRCLDQEGEDMIKKKVTELCPGDNIIFIKDSSEDIFLKLVGGIERSNPTVQNQMLLTKLWRKALFKYKEENGYESDLLQKQLENIGLKRTINTIRLWLNDEEQIGPDDEGIRAIARMTKDVDLNDKIEQVITACGKIRALHVVFSHVK